jgi:hypothetical protein
VFCMVDVSLGEQLDFQQNLHEKLALSGQCSSFKGQFFMQLPLKFKLLRGVLGQCCSRHKLIMVGAYIPYDGM